MILYHVTPTSNVLSIRKYGLIPAKGERSVAFGEPSARVYFFDNTDSVFDALMGWLGDVFDVDLSVGLSMVCVKIDAENNEVEWEFTADKIVSPSSIIDVYDVDTFFDGYCRTPDDEEEILKGFAS